MHLVNYCIVRDGVARIAMDNPPVNALNFALRADLFTALDKALADDDVKAIVVTGNAKGFSGGAEISEFNAAPGEPGAFTEPNLGSITALVEGCNKPVVAAVTGNCLGGGLELALACHYRVSGPGAMIGLPEVTLGLLPGAGGTQRLPRLIGVEAATNMIVSGHLESSDDLEKTGIFDGYVTGDIVEGAIDFAADLARKGTAPRRVGQIRVSHPQQEAFFQFVRNNVKPASRNYPAPMKCVDAVEAAASMKLDKGLEVEAEAFQYLMRTPEAAALQHGFFAQRAAGKIDDLPKDTPQRKIESVAVIGAGTMGGGISMCFINAGIPVYLLEMNQKALDAGLGRIRGNYEASVKRGKMSTEKLEEVMALITPVLSIDAIKDVDLVIEAVFENMDVKKDIFGKLGGAMKDGAILATNTSMLDVNEIAKASGRVGDVVGMHFFSPANIMKLLEVVRGAETAPDVMATVMAVAKKIRKTAVVSGVCDGFIGNRMLNQYLREAFAMIEEGATPYAIDKAIEDWGMAMGPFRMLDLAGNDVHWAVRKDLAAKDPDYRSSVIADAICEQGHFGQKTGRGWYLYGTGVRKGAPDPELLAMIDEQRQKKNDAPRKIANDEIVERLVFALANEGASILEEGIAQRASDIDVVYLAGYGFPAFRGGPMKYADQIGLFNVVRALEARADSEPGGARAPAPFLSQLAADHRTFN